MNLIQRVLTTTQAVLESGSDEMRRPWLKKHSESNVKGMFIIGDLAGAPVIKLAMEQGVRVIDHISARMTSASLVENAAVTVRWAFR